MDADFDWSEDIAEVPVLDEMLGVGDSMDVGNVDIALDDLPDVDSYIENSAMEDISDMGEVDAGMDEELRMMLEDFDDVGEDSDPEVKELVKVKTR